MKRIAAMSLVGSLIWVATVSANMPANWTKTSFSFDGIDKYADHAFFLQANIDYDVTLREVKNSTSIRLDVLKKSVSLALLAIDRQEFEKRKKNDPSLKWLREGKEGVISAKLKTELLAPTGFTMPPANYRVSLKDGKLSAEKIEPKKTGAASPLGFVSPLAFGLVSSLSIAWLGIWFCRRHSAPCIKS